MAVIEQGSNPAEQDSFETAKQLQELAPAPPSAESLAANADDIFATIRGAIEKGEPKSEGYKRAYENYIAQEDDPSLKAQAQILIGAEKAAKVDARLSEVKQKLSQSPTPDLKEERRHLVDQILPYNHLVRDFVYNNPGTFSSQQLENWLSRGSGGNSVWARAIVKGLAGEVAIARAAAAMPEVRHVRLGTLNEDKRGIDLVITSMTGRDVPVDVKAGGKAAADSYARGDSIGAEFGIHDHELDDFTVRKDSIGAVQDRIEKVITT